MKRVLGKLFSGPLAPKIKRFGLDEIPGVTANAALQKLTSSDDAWACGFLSHHAERLARMGKRDVARNCVDEALRIAERSGDPGLLGQAHVAVAKLDKRRHAYDAAREHTDQAYNWVLQGDSGVATRDALHDLVDLYAFLGEHDRAVEVAQRLVDINRGRDNALDLGIALANLGRRFRVQERWSDALPVFKEAYAVLQSSPELYKVPTVPWQLADDISDCCLKLGDLAGAIETMERERDGHVKMGHPDWVTLLSTRLGAVYTQQGDLDRAVARIEEALDRFQIVDDDGLIHVDPTLDFRLYLNLAHVRRLRGELDAAEDALCRAHSWIEANPDDPYLEARQRDLDQQVTLLAQARERSE